MTDELQAPIKGEGGLKFRANAEVSCIINAEFHRKLKLSFGGEVSHVSKVTGETTEVESSSVSVRSPSEGSGD